MDYVNFINKLNFIQVRPFCISISWSVNVTPGRANPVHKWWTVSKQRRVFQRI